MTFTDLKVFLVDGTNGTEFVNSFSNDDVQLYFIIDDTSLQVSVRTDFLEEFTSDSRILNIKKFLPENTQYDAAPPFPPVRYQQGSVLTKLSENVGTETSNAFYFLEEDRLLFRPLFGSPESVAAQKAAIQNAQVFTYLGSHYMGSQMVHTKPTRIDDRSGQSTLPTVGRSPYDAYWNRGPYGYSLDPVNDPKEFQYSSRFFGKNVDIIILEPSHPRNDGLEKIDIRMPNHPEWGDTVADDLNILGNERPNLGDVPEGTYNHSGSRIILQDYPSYDGNDDSLGSIIPSTGTSLGGKMSLLSRYNNSRLSALDRAPITSHMAMCLSLAGGLSSGYAKRANLYPRYTGDGLEDTETSTGWSKTVDNIIEWHNSKPINPETGLQNPTICSTSWGLISNDLHYYVPIDSIKSINHLGTIINRPSGGWGSDLRVFVDINMIPYRFKNPTLNTWQYAIPLSGGGINREGENFGMELAAREAYERLATSGITVVSSAGNIPTVSVKSDDPEYNDHFIMDENAEFFEAVTEDGSKGIASYAAINAQKDEKFYPFRLYYRNFKRDTVIVVGAGQGSHTFPVITNYSARGSHVDIIGDATGTLAADIGTGSIEPVKTDVTLGNHYDLDPNSSMYSNSFPFPFRTASTASDQTFAIPDKGLSSSWANTIDNTGWYLSNGNSTQLYQSERLFTSDGASPQESSWSTPRVIGQTGATDSRRDNTITRFAYRKNSTTQSGDTSEAYYADYTTAGSTHPSKLPYMEGLEDEWSTQPPALTADGDIIYRIERVFNNTLYFQDEFVVNTWSTPVIVARRIGSQDQKTVSVFSKDVNSISFLEGEDLVRITSLGSGTQQNWNDYFQTTNINYAVGDIISSLPPLGSTTPPPGAKISEPGWHFQNGSGTSAACPSVAGRLACMAEEYLHANGVWPTTDQLRALLLNSAKEVDLSKTAIEWSDTPPASDADDGVNFPSTSVFKSYWDIGHSGTDAIRDFEWAGGFGSRRGSTNDFTTREGELKPNTTGWLPENTASGSITIDKNTIASSKSTERVSPVPEYAFVRSFDYLDQPGVNLSTLTSGSNGFRDTNNNRIKFKEGDIISQTSTSFQSYVGNVDKGVVVEYDDNIPCTVQIATFSEVFASRLETEPGQTLDWSTIPSEDFNSIVLTAKQVHTKTEENKHYAQLKNESGQSGPAGIYCTLKLKYWLNYKITVESNKPVNIQLRNVSDNNSVAIDYQQSLLGSGTITPGEARTSVMLAGQDSYELVANTLLWEQMERADFDFDKNGAADALTDGLLFLRYLFNLTGDALVSNATAPNSTATQEEIIESLRIAEQTFGDIDANGTVDALTDGLLLLRYLFNLRSDALISDVVAENATRTSAKDIEEYIQSLLPKKGGTIGTFGYRSLTNSAVKNDWPTKDLGNVYNYYSIPATEPELLPYSNPVGLELFDTKYFVHPDPYRNGIFQNRSPYTAYPGTAWRWTQLSGQFFTSNMGELSTSTFTDNSGTTRTIDDMWWTNGQDAWTERPDSINSVDRPFTPKGIFCFSLRGTNIPNTSQTFTALTVNSVPFKRTDAYYSADSNGNTVWWWHITCRPFADSQFEKLGKSISDWSIFASFKNELLYTPPSTPVVENRPDTYTLHIRNASTAVNYTTFVDFVSCLSIKTGWPENHVHNPGDPDILSGGEGTNYSVNVLSTMQPAGVTPLRAHYESGAILKGDISPVRTFKASKASEPLSVGAIFPAQTSSLSSTNDMTELETTTGLTKFGWQRTDPGTVIPENERINTKVSIDDILPPIATKSSVPDQDYHILITTILPRTVTVPANGTFTVGPVNTAILPEQLPGATVQHPTVTYQWQKSTDANTWTNIASDDTTYTNSQTQTLTVTNYSGQSPAGDYYRCSISTTPLDLGTELTEIVTAITG